MGKPVRGVGIVRPLVGQKDPAVLFVGSFRDAGSDGVVGGQIFACRALLESPLSEQVRWILIDGTMESLPPPPLHRRALLAARRVWKVSKLLFRQRPRAALIFTSFTVFSLTEKVLVGVLCRLFGVRVVVTLRSEVDAAKMGFALRCLRRCLLASSHVIICQSDRAVRALAGSSPSGRSQLIAIPNWIDSSSYAAVPALSISPGELGPPRFLYLGWWEPYKGVNELLAAFEQVLRYRPDACLDICGGGSASHAMRFDIQRRSIGHRVRMLGWVNGEEKIRLLTQCFALLLPSYSEGMPNAVLEAMASARPVVATLVGGVPELVEDGRTGYLVQPRDIDGLVTAMRRLIEHPQEARDMGVRARQRVLVRHDVKTIWKAVARALDVI